MTLPNLIVLGAQKSGTSALYVALYQHPQIYMSRAKEPWFFAYENTALAFANPDRAVYEDLIYTELTRYQALYANAGAAPIRGEASTAYLMADCVEVTATNIQRHLPDAKLVVILRQPAERAYSAFCHLRMLQFEPERDFQRALLAEESAHRAAWPPDFRYRANGNYASLLAPYLARFDRAQIRIYLYEEWLTQPQETLRDLFGWLGVETTVQAQMVRRVYETRRVHSHLLNRLLVTQNAFKAGVRALLPAAWRQAIFRALHRSNNRRFPPLAPKIWQELTDGYRDDILHLQTMLDRDLGHWLTPRRDDH